MDKALLVIVALILIVGWISCEFMLWDECRQDHSFLYCSRVLGK